MTNTQALHSGGMVDEIERDAMAAPVEARMRRLEMRGPTWRSPGVAEVRGAAQDSIAVWACPRTPGLGVR